MNQQPTPTLIAIAIVHWQDCVLIGQRGPDVPLAGFWEFPGGKVEPGESSAAAAARECLEETGLAIKVGEPYPDVLHTYDHDRVRLHFFRCTWQPPSKQQQSTVQQSEPLAPFRWVPIETLDAYEFPPANTGILKILSEA